MSKKPRRNYERDWQNLITKLCNELIKLNKLPTLTVEDMWVKGVIVKILGEMCALDRVHPDYQKQVEFIRPLFED
ncbi:hypothetical protein LCGC14_2235810 [marine sediment metagenome]|uniref:Uncharacterized protein n=1 Tax=marine sediment metagenome TaxID=412755 RepID=A0A0F9G1Y9_9ZZZZ